jgi:hypothetical protein
VVIADIKIMYTFFRVNIVTCKLKDEVEGWKEDRPGYSRVGPICNEKNGNVYLHCISVMATVCLRLNVSV